MTEHALNELHEARWELLDPINNSTDKFMIVDFTVGLNKLLQTVRDVIWILSIYALGVFGYLTAAFASYSIGVDQSRMTRRDAVKQDQPTV